MAGKDWLDRAFDLHARLGSTFQAEREAAQRKLIKLLNSKGRTWNDLPELLEVVRKRRAPPIPPQAPAPPPPTDEPLAGRDLFNGIRAVLRQYLSLEEDEYVVCTLWPMHTYVCRRFMHTPRLVLSSALRGCGKTTGLDVLKSIVACPQKSDNLTAASFIRFTNMGDSTWGPTVLIDEVDNLALLTNPFFRASLNSGHRQGGSIQRTIQNVATTFRTFAPVVLAGIGSVPLPLARRSLVIHLKRDPQAPLRLKRFDGLDVEQIEMFAMISAHLAVWAKDCVLASDPPMPPELTGSQCDNWRVLIGIADACGPEIGELAQEVAVRMSQDLDEDFEVLLLRDIRDLFDQKRINRLASAAIVEHLNLLPHGLWSDWRGKDDTEAPRPLTAAIMAKLLASFRIRPTTIWPVGRNADSKTAIIGISSRTAGRVIAQKPTHRHTQAKSGSYADT
jgi:hypothetical protein